MGLAVLSAASQACTSVERIELPADPGHDSAVFLILRDGPPRLWGLERQNGEFVLPVFAIHDPAELAIFYYELPLNEIALNAGPIALAEGADDDKGPV